MYDTYFFELISCPAMRLSGPVAWEICGGDVGDGFRIDADDLGVVSFVESKKKRSDVLGDAAAPHEREQEAPWWATWVKVK
jgi:hypothetical protein